MTVDNAEALREALHDRLPGLSPPERRAEFLGLLQKHLPPGKEAILVGGGLVELLTGGMYVTGDLDVIGDPGAIADLLAAAGFEQAGRHLVEEEMGLVVEIVASALEPDRRTERLRWREHTLTVLSLEDIIVDRLCAAKFWESSTDHEQARLVYATHRARIDEDRLRTRAEAERVDDLLEELDPEKAGDPE